MSLIATVKNESASLDQFLASLGAQSRQPDEIVVVDGGSTDGTQEQLERLAATDPRVKVFSAPESNIARGRNLAIERARGPIIAATDAGTVLASTWLEKLVLPLERDPRLAVSSGFYEPGGRHFFERCLSTVTLPHPSEIDSERFLPSSRSVAFRKEWWAEVGGYPEFLAHCEDLVFDFSLKRAGAVFVFVEDATVTWAARPTLGAFFRQYFNYARGDGHADLWPRRHAVRYLAYVTGVGLVVAIARGVPGARFCLLSGVALHHSKYLRRVLRRPPSDRATELLAALALVPVIVTVGDVAKMIGYPLGRYERSRRKFSNDFGLEGVPNEDREL